MPHKRRSKTFSKRKTKHKRVNIYVYARMLKARMTKAEVLLWVKLQSIASVWGVEFECQGVIAGRFVADFVCRERMLIIELDGSIHRLSRVKAKDKYRTVELIKLGYKVIRFDNTEVFRRVSKVLNSILLNLNN